MRGLFVQGFPFCPQGRSWELGQLCVCAVGIAALAASLEKTDLILLLDTKF